MSAAVPRFARRLRSARPTFLTVIQRPRSKRGRETSWPATARSWPWRRLT